MEQSDLRGGKILKRVNVKRMSNVKAQMPKVQIILICFSLILAVKTSAVTTLNWVQTTEDDFNQGELKDTSITSQGEVKLSPPLEEVFTSDELYIWSLALDKKGNIYAGSGNNGIIFKIVKGSPKPLIFNTEEIGVHSLALDAQDNIYVGTSPRGIIYKLTSDGKIKVFYDSKEQYIWALVFDRQGNLFAGAGYQGRVYKISKSGEGRVFYDSLESHIMCLTVDEKDFLYAGSESRGIVYKINPQGKAFALLDTPQKEIHCLALDSKGNLYAGTAGEEKAPEGGEEKLSPDKKIRSIIYKITPEGVAQEWFRSSEPHILSMAFDKEDNLYLGTGNGGLIYKINPQGEATTLKVSQPQILSFLIKENEIFFSTGNLGSIFKASLGYERKGTFTSLVYDAKGISAWGNISWKANTPPGTKIILQSRSGNTEGPDNTWSEWSKGYKDSQGQKIESPPAEFIQYKATLLGKDSSQTPILDEVSLAYQQKNLPPEILEVKVFTGDEKPPESSRGGEKEIAPAQPPPPPPAVAAKRPAQRIIIWKAIDPNGDSLIYDLYFKGEEEENWKELEKDFPETLYSPDWQSFADGVYLIKVIAKDSPSNPEDVAKSCEKISRPFLIDNTRPEFKDLEAKVYPPFTCIIRGEVRDALSNIKSLEYSLDAKKWVAIFPQDGLFDSQREEFKFTLTNLNKGERTIMFRATDQADNIGAGKIVVRVEVRSGK